MDLLGCEMPAPEPDRRVDPAEQSAVREDRGKQPTPGQLLGDGIRRRERDRRCPQRRVRPGTGPTPAPAASRWRAHPGAATPARPPRGAVECEYPGAKRPCVGDRRARPAPQGRCSSTRRSRRCSHGAARALRRGADRRRASRGRRRPARRAWRYDQCQAPRRAPLPPCAVVDAGASTRDGHASSPTLRRRPVPRTGQRDWLAGRRREPRGVPPVPARHSAAHQVGNLPDGPSRGSGRDVSVARVLVPDTPAASATALPARVGDREVEDPLVPGIARAALPAALDRLPVGRDLADEALVVARAVGAVPKSCVGSRQIVQVDPSRLVR